MQKYCKIMWLLLMGITLFACHRGSDVINHEEYYRNYYEIFVGAFYDSDDDGVGDLNGVTAKLDYLQELGVNGIWLMPVMPSPSYHKYDVIDYYAIDPQYGTLADFEHLLTEAKKRDMVVIIDLVLNHTSSEHPWFVQAKKELYDSIRNDDNNKSYCYLDYYNFSPNRELNYHNTAMPDDWYYEGIFWDGMPDLNLDNEQLRAEIIAIARFWLDKGVFGFRLDATSHFYPDDEQNIAFLAWLKDALPDSYIVGEAWINADAMAGYYASGIDSFFNFPFSGYNGTILEDLRRGRGYDLAQKLETWQQTIERIDPLAIDAIFLSNHDQPRSAGYFTNKLQEQKLAAAIYLLMPGNPFMYYGEEIGMTGFVRDEDKRQPMFWSTYNSQGMANPVMGTTQVQSLESGVVEQMVDKSSLWWFYKNALAIKQEYPTLAFGRIEALDLGHEAIMAYRSIYNERVLYVVHNLHKDEVVIKLEKKHFWPEEVKATLHTSWMIAEPSHINQLPLTMPTRYKETLVMPGYSTAILE